MKSPQITKEIQTMLQEEYNTKILGLSNVSIEDIQENEGKIHIKIRTEKREQVCPCCGNRTSYVHDYRLQIIKGLSIRKKEVYLFLNKRRYVCMECGKRFIERYEFLPRYAHCTRDVYSSIITSFNENRTVKDIAKDHNVSSTTVERLLDKVAVKNKPELPEVMGIDEFKGNTNGEKYQVILTDVQHNKVLNILPTRFKKDLTEYFWEYPIAERAKVRVLVMDMWEDYRRLAWLFPNAVIVTDRYHWIRQINWALDKVRKRVQRTLPHWTRLYVKRLRYLLHKPYNELDVENKIALRNILETNTDLYNAWQLKEMFYEFKDATEFDFAREAMLNFWVVAEEINLPEFKDCISALHNWAEPILNSFKYKYTNAFTEGCNNKIKVIKRISYGYRRFDRFRKRILLQTA